MSRQHHYLKTLQKYFIDVEKGVKNFEVRVNARRYSVGDMLHLHDFAGGEYTGREITKEICYILDSKDYCKEGYVVLGMK